MATDEKDQAPKPARYWIGPEDMHGRPTEYFVGVPTRDLTKDDMEALTDEQRDLLKSPAGKRLYSASPPDGKDSSTAVPSAGGSSPSGTSEKGS